jgi:aspartokinase-like uncharacterized kinase
MTQPLWVIKLGGSLACSESLDEWLTVLTEYGRGRVVVCPGGGPFADTVRRAQARWAFDDGLAHRMAILAMEQYGLMLSGMAAGLVAVSSAGEIRAALRTGAVPVWLPGAMTADRAHDIAPCWEMTSDSLAAWLAGRLGVPRLVLVKSIDPPPGPVPASALAALGLVDPMFPGYVQRTVGTAWCLGKKRAGVLRLALANGAALDHQSLITPG